MRRARAALRRYDGGAAGQLEVHGRVRGLAHAALRGARVLPHLERHRDRVQDTFGHYVLQ